MHIFDTPTFHCQRLTTAWLKWLTLYDEDKEMLTSFEEKTRWEYLVSWSGQEVSGPGQSWVTSSNWTILTSSIRTFQVLWHASCWVLPSSLTWLPSKKVSNKGCYMALISTLWNFLNPSNAEISKGLNWIKCLGNVVVWVGGVLNKVSESCENQWQAENETIKPRSI